MLSGFWTSISVDMGVVDHFLVWKNGKKKDVENCDPSWGRKTYYKPDSDAVMIFLGWRKKRNELRRLYSRFADNTRIVYELPNTLLASDPATARNAFLEITGDVRRVLERHDVRTAYGLSLGGTLACYAANHSPTIEKVLAVLPGDRIAPVMWRSPITRTVVEEAKKLGFAQEDFQKALGEFDPVNNLAGLVGKEIRILLAKGDSIIPYKHGVKLVEEMRAAGLRPEVTVLPFLGHLLCAAYSVHYMKKHFYN